MDILAAGPRQGLLGDPPLLAPVDHPESPGRLADDDVVRHGEIGNERELLEDRYDAGVHGGRWVGKADPLPLEGHVAPVRRDHAGQVHYFAGSSLRLGGIHHAVAARPDGVVGLGKIGDQVAAAVVGHHGPAEARGQVGGLGDDPNAGFRPLSAGHHAADVIRIYKDRFVLRLLGWKEIPAGVQLVIAKKFKCRAVELVRARLYRDVDLRS